jgi:hypothetical protein
MGNYWVVGAMFGGKDDQYDLFLKRGYWYCWDPNNSQTPDEAKNRFHQIRPDDRIAIKRMLGRGSREIEIRAIGIVKDVDLKEWRVYVDWIITNISHKVPINGCAGSIHGPFEENNIWVHQTFHV